MVSRDEETQSTTVGADDAIVAPLLSGYLLKTRIDAHRRAVPSVVRCHECTASSFYDTFVEGVGVVFTEQAVVEVAGGRVTSILIAVGEEMLHQRCRLPVFRMVALYAFRHGDRQFACQVCILTKTFLCPSPTRIASQVGVWRIEYQATTFALLSVEVVSGFFCHLIAHLSNALSIPGFAQSVGLWKHCSKSVVGHFLAIHGFLSIVECRSAKG